MALTAAQSMTYVWERSRRPEADRVNIQDTNNNKIQKKIQGTSLFERYLTFNYVFSF